MKKFLKSSSILCLILLASISLTGCFGSENFLTIKEKNITSVIIQQISFGSYQANFNGYNFSLSVDASKELTSKSDWQKFYDECSRLVKQESPTKIGALEDESHVAKEYDYRIIFRDGDKTNTLFFGYRGANTKAIFFDGSEGHVVTFNLAQDAISLLPIE